VGVIAKQSNDFSGEPGNDLGPLVNSRLTTEVTTGCGTALRFLGAPANGVVGRPLTTTPAGPVTVEVIDAAGHRVTASSAEVTLSLGPESGPGVLSGTNPIRAVAGVATFSNLSIGLSGSYTLLATSPGLTSATSAPFRVDDAAVPCDEDVACTATLSLPDKTASLNVIAAPPMAGTDAGLLTINSAPALNCDGYDELLARSFAVDFIPDPAGTGRTKVVTATISKDVMSQIPENGAAHLEMCFGAPFTFTVKPGTPPLQQPQPGLFIGLLPDCGSAPCVSRRNKTKAGQGIIEVQAPGGPRTLATAPRRSARPVRLGHVQWRDRRGGERNDVQPGEQRLALHAAAGELGPAGV
jgi:hypothetical protein